VSASRRQNTCDHLVARSVHAANLADVPGKPTTVDKLARTVLGEHEGASPDVLRLVHCECTASRRTIRSLGAGSATMFSRMSHVDDAAGRVERMQWFQGRPFEPNSLIVVVLDDCRLFRRGPGQPCLAVLHRHGQRLADTMEYEGVRNEMRLAWRASLPVLVHQRHAVNARAMTRQEPGEQVTWILYRNASPGATRHER